MFRNRGLFHTFIKGFTVFSLIFTIVVVGLFITKFDDIGRTVQIISLIKTQYLQDSTTAQLINGALKGMVGSLNDPYSVYMDPKEYRELQAHIQGSYGGIGVYVDTNPENQLVIVAPPIAGTPAERAGIQSGDVIIKIDGKNTAEMSIDQAVANIQGQPGTDVVLTIYRASAKRQLDVKLTREIIDVPTVAGELLKEDPRIAYMSISMFSSHTDEDFNAKLAELMKQGFQGLILDLRNNPGGNLDTAVNIAYNFVPKGPVVYVVDKQGREEVFEAPGNNIKKPLVVLINGGSASASEILAGAIKDTKTGTLVGTKSFGKGLVQSVFPLSGGAGIKLTTAKYLTPAKQDIHKKGIVPDIEVEIPEGKKAGNEDPQLQKAIEVIKDKIS